MNRGQRKAHAWTWTVLALAVVSLSAGALVLRGKTDEATRAWAAKAGGR